MARQLDDRPVPGDSGMVESGPRPQMNALGRAICRDILDRTNATYTCSWDNTTIFVAALADFVHTVRFLARQSGNPVAQMAFVNGQLVRPVIAMKMRIDLVLRGEPVEEFLGAPGVSRQGGVVSWDTRKGFDLNGALHAMARRDGTLG